MIFKPVHGRFPILSAEVLVDADGAPLTVTATLDAAGFSTDNPKRDTHVRGEDFLHADAHPHPTFRSTAAGAGYLASHGSTDPARGHQ
ncbi:YceI family protein [Streptomyces mirabilis]|uniref:YceI family protein n=1 Tax=Streptomyces mirabilis TaxID=68239 RepID=UPI00338E4883